MSKSEFSIGIKSMSGIFIDEMEEKSCASQNIYKIIKLLYIILCRCYKYYKTCTYCIHLKFNETYLNIFVWRK